MLQFVTVQLLSIPYFLSLHLVLSQCNIGRRLGDRYCDDDANNEACEYDKGDCCLSDENSLRFCTECLCKEPGKKTVERKRLQSSPSSTEDSPTGFKDCGKRLAERDAGLGFSNGQSVSTRQVILNHILALSM